MNHWPTDGPLTPGGLHAPWEVPGRFTQSSASARGEPVFVVAGLPRPEFGGLHQIVWRLPPRWVYIGPLPLSDVLTMKCLPPSRFEIFLP